MSEDPRLTPDQLKVGLYIYLDLKWMEHPFAFSHFKIKSEDQVKVIRALGLKTLRFNPALSDCSPDEPGDDVPEEPSGPVVVPEPSAEVLAKRAMMEQMQQRREATGRVERAFTATAQSIKDIEKNLYSQPRETVRQAAKLITEVTNSILSAPEIAVHVMGDKMGSDELYFHSLNVTMLSMMVARDLKLPVEVAGALGMGALMHDIGHKEVPDKIRLKTEPLTRAERNFFEMHCQYGETTGKRMLLAPTALNIIREHHEFMDGSGYPARLKGEAINPLARIVVIANYYDELCNPGSLADALTPHEALSLMFSKLRSKFDPKILEVFIRCLGVYPPGTLVQLSDKSIAMVATINPAKPLKPTVVVYDATVPKNEAIMIDMAQETEVHIVTALRPAQVPPEVYNYLSPRKQVSYFIEASAPPPKPARPSWIKS
jgi:putative nucleotidyltransferase with HDIG domain